MQDYDVRDQMNILRKHGILTGEETQQATDILMAEFWHDRIGDIWTAADVVELGNNQGFAVTADQAMEILLQIQREYDSEDGINCALIIKRTWQHHWKSRDEARSQESVRDV